MAVYQEVVDLDAEPLLDGEIDDIDIEKAGCKTINLSMACTD